MDHKILSIGWIEFIYAWLLGAPVKGRSGRVYRRPTFRKAVSKFLDWALWGLDVSKWQGLINWVKVKAAGIKFLILRASYGIWPDERFVEYIKTVITIFIGWRFGIYHYYDPRFSPRAQADVLLAAIAPYRKYIRRVWIDLEFTWGGSFEASKYWQEFAMIITDAGYEIGFYTRATWWDSRVGALAWWFGQYPLWAAQYSSKLTYIPVGWSKADIWQDGIRLTDTDFGVGAVGSKEYDHDIMDSEFYKTEIGTLPTDPPPDADKQVTIFNGVTRITGTRHGWDFSLLVSDPDKVAFSVVHPDYLSQGTKIAADTAAQIILSGGEWDRISHPKDYSVSFGLVYVTRKEAVPSFMIDRNHSITIDHVKRPDILHAISGLRYIVQGGELPAHLDGSEAQYTEGHSRAIDGIDTNGNHMRLTSAGAYPNQGLTLKQAALIIQEYGAVTAFDEGGGGDVTEVINGILTNVPENPGGTQRYLPQFLLIYADELGDEPMPTTNGTAKELLGNIPVVRKTPSRYGDEVIRLYAGAVVEFVEQPVAVIPEGNADIVGEKWLPIVAYRNSNNEYVPVSGYVNFQLFAGGVLRSYFAITQQPTTDPTDPPADGEPSQIVMNLAAGSDVTIKDSEGNILWSGMA